MDLVTSLMTGAGGGMIFRVLSFVMSQWGKRSDAINQSISKADNSGYDPNRDSETIHTSNIIALGMFCVFACIMLVCLAFPKAEFKHIIYQPGDVDRYIDLFLFKWTWGADLEKYVVYTSSGDLLYSGLTLISFCLTAFYKTGK